MSFPLGITYRMQELKKLSSSSFNDYSSANNTNGFISFFGILFLFLFLSLTDFFILQFPFLTLVAVFLVSSYWLISNPLNKKASIYVLAYTFLIFLITAINMGNINWMLVVPLIAWLFVSSFTRVNHAFDVITAGAKCLTILIFFVCIFELFTKFNFISLSIYTNFITEYGDQRFDVLRTRSLFGSPLSTAALSIVAFFFWTHVRPSFKFALVAFIIALLSGSRTAFILCVSIFIFSPLAKFLIIRQFTYIKTIIMAPVVLVIFYAFDEVNFDYFDRLYSIIIRALTPQFDASFLGRADTSLLTLYALIQDLPLSLFVGIDEPMISDSAFISVSANSGIIAAASHLFLILVFLFKSILPIKSKAVLFVVLILGGSMIGDMFVPAVSFLLFAMLFSVSRGEQVRSQSFVPK